MTSILRTDTVAKFSCLGDKCPDTCCRGWSMQVDETTLDRYKTQAPELLVAVEPGQGETPWIMRKDSASGYCIKLEGGMCGIHKAYGDKFLGDACHFYPRITRRLGDRIVMSAATSCPEIVRLALEESDPLALSPADIDRLPASLRNYLPDGMGADEALAVHRAFLDVMKNTDENAETMFARMASVSRSIEVIEKKNWPQAVPVYLKIAHTLLPAPEIHVADPFNLLHALMGLIVASKKPMSERLRQTVETMEKALAVTLDWNQVLIHTREESGAGYRQIAGEWQERYAAPLAPVLKKYLAMQLSMALFPFAGLGESLSDRITLIGVRLATIKLALMCECAIARSIPPQEVAIRIVQSLSRFLDHLGDPAFSLSIYSETGWVREARMRGLLNT